MTEPLTHRQSQILRWIVDYRAQHGYSPTVREIADGVGISSPNGVEAHLTALIEKGTITRELGKARTIVPVEPPDE